MLRFYPTFPVGNLKSWYKFQIFPRFTWNASSHLWNSSTFKYFAGTVNFIILLPSLNLTLQHHKDIKWTFYGYTSVPYLLLLSNSFDPVFKGLWWLIKIRHPVITKSQNSSSLENFREFIIWLLSFARFNKTSLSSNWNYFSIILCVFTLDPHLRIVVMCLKYVILLIPLCRIHS